MNLAKNIDIRVPHAEHAAYASDRAHEHLAYATNLATAHQAARVTLGDNLTSTHYDSDDVWDRLSDCLHRGKLANDWLYVELDAGMLTVQYGDHDPVHIDTTAVDTVGSLAERVLDDLSEQAIRRLAEVTRHIVG